MHMRENIEAEVQNSIQLVGFMGKTIMQYGVFQRISIREKPSVLPTVLPLFP